MLIRLLAVLLLLPGLARATPPLPSPLREQVLRLPGDPADPVDLQVTLFLPDGPGPFPLAVMNHGASGARERPADMQRYRATYSAFYFLSRGYAVALPMARGFAGSGGTQGNWACDLAGVALRNARDVAQVIGALGRNASIDTRRVVVAGQSFGGLTAMAVGTLHLAGLRALVNFNGGIRSSGCPAGAGGDRALFDAAARFGQDTTVPSVWFYGENDTLFPHAVWRGMADRYNAAGGHAQVVDVGSFMEDSHQLLSHGESLPIWTPRVDSLLAAAGLPSREVSARFLPVPVPPPTRFARLDDVTAVPDLTPASQAAYRGFLAQALPRAFVVTASGQSVATQGGFDPLGRAMSLCASHGLACRPYAVDRDVVWVPAPGPVASHYASLTDVAALPTANPEARRGYARFLALPAPRAFVLAADGGWFCGAGHRGDVLSLVMATCARTHSGCAAYAVDSTVVWRGGR